MTLCEGLSHVNVKHCGFFLAWHKYPHKKTGITCEIFGTKYIGTSFQVANRTNIIPSKKVI